MNTTQSETNWERVVAHQEGDAIPYEPGDGPYDPNDAEAARLAGPGRSDPSGQGGAPGWQTRIDGALLEVIRKRAAVQCAT